MSTRNTLLETALQPDIPAGEQYKDITAWIPPSTEGVKIMKTWRVTEVTDRDFIKQWAEEIAPFMSPEYNFDPDLAGELLPEAPSLELI